MDEPPRRDAAYFDEWYADMGASAARDAIVARTLGLPADLQSTSLLSWQGIAEVTDALRLKGGDLLLDIACGRGGYGIEIAKRTSTQLVGLDFSAVAINQAMANASARLSPDTFEFRVGSMSATGLPGSAAQAVVCVDAVQFSDPPLEALQEFRRLLTPGGRLVLTTWEAVDPTDERVSGRLRAVNLRRDLPAAGFLDIDVQDRPDWLDIERAMWTAVTAAPDDEADPAIRSLKDEGRRSLAGLGSLRRVFASATAP
jgi:SAM-dependent methyltransferase